MIFEQQAKEEGCRVTQKEKGCTDAWQRSNSHHASTCHCYHSFHLQHLCFCQEIFFPSQENVLSISQCSTDGPEDGTQP